MAEEEIEKKEAILRAKYNPTKMDLKPEQIVGFFYERQIRTEKQQQQYREMVANIKTGGIIDDLSVRRIKGEPDKFEGIFGYMRYLAGKEAETPVYPANVYPADMSNADVLFLILSENIIGVDTSPIDLAEQIHLYQEETGYSNKTIASLFDKSDTWVGDLKKLRANTALSEAVTDGKITKSQAEELGRISNPELLAEAIEKATGTTVAQTVTLVAEMRSQEEKVARIETLRGLIEAENQKIMEGEKRWDEKKRLKSLVVITEKQLEVMDSNTPEEIIELTSTINRIEQDYFGTGTDMQRFKAQIAELEEELAAREKEKLEKERTSLDKAVQSLSEKIKKQQEELKSMKAELGDVQTRLSNVLQGLVEYDEITNEISNLRGQYKQAEQKRTRVAHELENDIKYFDKVKAMLTEEKVKYAEKRRALENELNQLNAELKKFGGMPLSKRKERVKMWQEELDQLTAEHDAAA